MSVTTKTIAYEQDGQTYEGFLAMPAGTAKAVVVVAHAWGGLSDFEREKAELLASWGYAGFAMDVYGKGLRGETNEECQALMAPLASNPDELRSRLRHSLAVAKTEAGTDRSAGVGFCFGGLCMFLMARANMPVKGVVSFHGLFGTSSETPEPIKPKILALHGWGDPMATPDDVLTFAREMDAANADWQLHAYGNTLHAFTDPAAQNPDFGTQYSPNADRRSFAACRDFLGELFG